MMRSNKTHATLVALTVSLAITLFAFSEPALAASSQNSIVMHEEIILTSTSGVYLNMTSGSQSVVGPASGTMTLEVVNGVTPGHLLTVKSGAVDLGKYHVPFLSGSAFMNNQETYIVGAGRVGGATALDPRGTFTFRAFSVGPTIRHSPLDFSVLIIHLQIGADRYEVLLQVTTSIIVGS
jgi:hypothetical protein